MTRIAAHVRRRSAYHEAGHAAMSARVGLPCHRLWVALERDGTGRRQTLGAVDQDTRSAFFTERDWTNPREWYRLYLVALAGDVAEHRLTGRGYGHHVLAVSGRVGAEQMRVYLRRTERHVTRLWPRIEAMAEAVLARPDGVLELAATGWLSE